MNLDPASGIPLYVQLVEGLWEAVASGEICGDEVPATRALAGDLRVNYHTVAKAYQELERSGILIRRRGEGYSVAEGAAEQAAQALLEQDLSRLARRVVAFQLDEAQVAERLLRAVRAARRRGA